MKINQPQLPLSMNPAVHPDCRIYDFWKIQARHNRLVAEGMTVEACQVKAAVVKLLSPASRPS